MGWLLTVLVWLYDGTGYVVGAVLEWLAATVGVLWGFWWSGVESLFGVLWGVVWDQMPVEWQSYLVLGFWEPMQPYIEAVNWFFPVYTIFQIVATTYAAIAGIRLVRWLLSFVPFVATG